MEKYCLDQKEFFKAKCLSFKDFQDIKDYIYLTEELDMCDTMHLLNIEDDIFFNSMSFYDMGIEL